MPKRYSEKKYRKEYNIPDNIFVFKGKYCFNALASKPVRFYYAAKGYPTKSFDCYVDLGDLYLPEDSWDFKLFSSLDDINQELQKYSPLKQSIGNKQREGDYVGLRAIWLVITFIWLPALMINSMGWTTFKNELPEFVNEFSTFFSILEPGHKTVICTLLFFYLLLIFFAIRGLLRVLKMDKIST